MSRQSIVTQAQSWLGCKESDGSHKEIIDLYNTISPLPRGYKLSYTDAWCAGFVSACAKGTGQTEIVFPECGCDAMIALYRAAGRWRENDDYMLIGILGTWLTAKIGKRTELSNINQALYALESAEEINMLRDKPIIQTISLMSDSAMNLLTGAGIDINNYILSTGEAFILQLKQSA